MQLPVAGQPLHTRALLIELTRGEGGPLRVHGHVIDLRKASFVPMLDEIHTAGLIHDMTLELCVDPATRRIEKLDVSQRSVAVEASERTRGESCRDVQPRMQELVGLVFDASLPAELTRRVGGPRGCTHLVTLLHLSASALPRALDLEEAQALRSPAPRRPGELIFRRSVFVDGHEPEVGRLHLAVQLMDFHSAPRDAVAGGIELLAHQHEVRVLADVSMTNLQLLDLAAIERVRSAATLGTAVWAERAGWARGLLGQPIMPGFGKRVRAELGDRPEAAQLADALVQLAPGFVQCTPALSDRAIQQAARQRTEAAAGGRPAGRAQLPAFLTKGGGADSCYMWRSDGPLLQIRPRGD